MHRVVADRLAQRSDLLVRPHPGLFPKSFRGVEVPAVEKVRNLASMPSRLILHVARNLHPTHNQGRVFEGGRVDAAGPAALGGYPRPRIVRFIGGLHDGSEFGLALARQCDDVPNLQRAENLHGFRLPAVQVVSPSLLFLLRQVPAQVGVLHQFGGSVVAWRGEGGNVAIQLGPQRTHLLLQPFYVAHLAHHGAVGLKLGERLLDQADRILVAVHRQHVDGHVVAGLEL